MNSRIGEGHMDPLEEGAVHQAMPQGIIEHLAQTSDRPQLSDRRKVHMRLGDVIPGTGVMRVKEETIPAIRTEEKLQIHNPYQGAMILGRGIQEMQSLETFLTKLSRTNERSEKSRRVFKKPL